MKTSFRLLQARQGIVLMSALALLSILMVVGVGTTVMLQNDFRILGNLRVATEAFYISVAGIEWAKSELARATNFPPVPLNQSKSFSVGHFIVTFQSSTVVSPLVARVTVHSTGMGHGAQNVLQAQLTKSYDLADAAVVLRGNGAKVSLVGDPVFISGADHDSTTGDPIGTNPRSSVSTSDETLRTLVAEALGTPPRQGLLDENADTPAIATSSYVSSSLITQMANDLCTSATASLHTLAPPGSLIIENQSWGNPVAPQLHCIEGLSGPGDAVTMSGNFVGAGILVVKNADLILSGTFRWEGLILVTGSDVSFKIAGPASKELLGAAMVNETGTPGAERKILDIEGAVRVLFSRQTLNRASTLLPAAMSNIASESLPSVISQDYWRSFTP